MSERETGSTSPSRTHLDGRDLGNLAATALFAAAMLLLQYACQTGWSTPVVLAALTIPATLAIVLARRPARRDATSFRRPRALSANMVPARLKGPLARAAMRAHYWIAAGITGFVVLWIALECLDATGIVTRSQRAAFLLFAVPAGVLTMAAFEPHPKQQ